MQFAASCYGPFVSENPGVSTSTNLPFKGIPTTFLVTDYAPGCEINCFNLGSVTYCYVVTHLKPFKYFFSTILNSEAPRIKVVLPAPVLPISKTIFFCSPIIASISLED